MTLRAPAGVLNPEAGDHPITADPGELAAAQKASQRSVEEFPYYALRFGERGARFGASDSGWLASLCAASPSYAREQVRWLGAVLSSRGMPTLLLERHLRILRDELIAAVPARRASYRVLLVAANELRTSRRKQISDAAAAEIAARFEGIWAAKVPEMGTLLVAAVADERNGIERAVASIEEWATDSARFPPPWIEAVSATILAARAI